MDNQETIQYALLGLLLLAIYAVHLMEKRRGSRDDDD